MASIKEYRDRDVFTHMNHLGEMLKSELNAAAQTVGSSFRASGPSSFPTFEMQGQSDTETQLMWDVFLQEVARGGVLFRRAGTNFVTFSHTEEDIKRTADVSREAFLTVERHRREDSLAEYSSVKEYAPSSGTI